MTDGERIAKLEVRFDSQDEEIKALRVDVRAILEHVAAAKGSWRTLLTLGGIVTGVTAVLAAVAEWVKS